MAQIVRIVALGGLLGLLAAKGSLRIMEHVSGAQAQPTATLVLCFIFVIIGAALITPEENATKRVR